MKHYKFVISPDPLRLYLLELPKMDVVGVWQGEDKVVGTWDYHLIKFRPTVYIRETRLQND